MALFEIGDKIGKSLVEEIRNQILLQGHRLTGALSKSVEYQLRSLPDGLLIQFLLFDYGLPVNNGVIPSRIPYGRFTGKKVSKYIEGLKRFAKIKFRVTEKQALGIAFAIARKHVKEGMPTLGSYKFSKTGKRTDFIEEAIKKEFNTIINTIGELEADFQNTFSKI